ncbi:acyl-CoA dehydrogenase family protein [Bradyrhizobium sp. 169]|uniref:acyl-CoA dehydrogenase family protein n=1 Tax=Bradyrhizobium sp. 169 TaxID=2782640 RepID=UPI001FF84D0F|nr:acyl-CoA dehydrogenase family protein [Bradyrhizobium sp. 169]MCK1589107.1 acyl-CoA dehydrogenase family protein [Bradyrhizobium sp. 169]
MTVVTTKHNTAIELSEGARAFQQEVREWLGANAPAKLKGVRGGAMDVNLTHLQCGKIRAEVQEWTERLHEAGYMCVDWPQEYGGRGLTAVEVTLLNEEFHRADVPRFTRGMGEFYVGPAIIAYGTTAQKAHFLPRIIDGTDRYCQGFSEPNAGSDLAGLHTKGSVEGDEIIVNGQKVWTSRYWEANMTFCLCRTDASAPKHRGISYVLIPIQNNGIEFRPIKGATGESHFAETFITGARAPLFNVIGGLNNGWKVAMTSLAKERSEATTQYVRFEADFWRLVDEAKKRGKLSDVRVREQLAWAYSNVGVLRMSGLVLLNALATEQDPGRGASDSVNKIQWSEYERRLGEIALDILGPEALVTGDNYELSPWQLTFLETRTHTIWGGTAEIQRNILAERVLGLPKEPTR